MTAMAASDPVKWTAWCSGSRAHGRCACSLAFDRKRCEQCLQRLGIAGVGGRSCRCWCGGGWYDVVGGGWWVSSGPEWVSGHKAASVVLVVCRRKQGAIILATGGDNSNGAEGNFCEYLE